jgi:hypothetical protein
LDVRDSTQSTGNGQPVTEPDWRSIFDAPDYTQIVKTVQTAKSREYAIKVKSVLKSGVIGALNINDFPDAAAILAYGPGFADAAGQLAEASPRAERAIEIITSPSNVYVTFALTALPFFAQIVRNHEPQLKELPNVRRNARLRRKAMSDAKKAEPPRFTIRLFGKEWPIRFRSRFKPSKVLALFKTQTQEPESLTINVFSDPKVIKALEKQGIRLTRVNSDTSST